MQLLETLITSVLLSLPVVYYITAFAKTGFRKTCHRLSGNRRAYLLIFEDSVLLFFSAGLLGTALMNFPSFNTTLAGYGIDLEEMTKQLEIQITLDTLRTVRLCLLGLAGWHLLLGILCALAGRRDLFDDVRDAVRYFVHQRRAFLAASYVGIVGTRQIPVPEVDNPAAFTEWNTLVEHVQHSLIQLDEAFRQSNQGGNVRVLLELGKRNLHFWRFGTQATLIAELREPSQVTSWVGGLLRSNPEEEFRALVAAIRTIAHVNGG